MEFRINKDTKGRIFWGYRTDRSMDEWNYVRDQLGNPIFQDLVEVNDDEREGLQITIHDVPKNATLYFDESVEATAYFPKKNDPTVYEMVDKIDVRKQRFVYYVDATDNLLRAVALGVKSDTGGGGFGAARSDTPKSYQWYGNKKLGYALGLNFNNYLGLAGNIQACDATMKIIGYYRTNTPLLLSPTDAKTNIAIPQNAEIIYYKKREKELDPFSVSPNEPEAPQLPVRGKVQNRPFKVETDRNRTAKSKDLKHASGKRSDAATVMYKPLVEDDPDFSKQLEEFRGIEGVKRLPATEYVQVKLSRDEVARKNWVVFYKNPKIHPNKLEATENQKKKRRGEIVEPVPADIQTNQEWCHLYGHGDGGREAPDNFVGGTHYANTEQLAIETGQRVGGYPNLSINVTAYRIRETELAGWIRYKIYAAKSNAPDRKSHKIFDHVFDGQNESFDYNQFKILKTTVERVIADGLPNNLRDDARTRYLERINARIRARDALAQKEGTDDTMDQWNIDSAYEYPWS